MNGRRSNSDFWSRHLTLGAGSTYGAKPEQGEVVGTHVSQAEQDVYDVQLDEDSKVYTFATTEIQEIEEAP